MSIDLSKLAEPFPAEDIEWRVSRAGQGRNGIYCRVLAYITARAIQARLDEVCGPANWALTEPKLLTHERKSAIAVGISIRIDGEWITRWDVAELTDGSDYIPPFKGGMSGAVKRAGAQWGIGRYLYHLDEAGAEVATEGGRGWNYATIKTDDGKQVYYWKPPRLPNWALPKEPDAEVSRDELNELKREWMAKFAEGVRQPAELVSGFSRFVESLCGEFPVSDHTCWTREAYLKCLARINETTEPGGVSPAVPFEE